MELLKRIDRDKENAILAQGFAKDELMRSIQDAGVTNFAQGVTVYQRQRIDVANARIHSLKAISEQSFHAMTEVVTESEENGRLVEKSQIWYANESSICNVVWNIGGKLVAVLAWTHPGFQLALTGELEEYQDVEAQGYSLISVLPSARAKFETILPDLAGIYDPGGSVGTKPLKTKKDGLKAVKLNMTRQQVEAFVSRMSGTMIVSGAPGSGKTTVAFQRIRFLFDQQRERRGSVSIEYSPSRTRVFLANVNLLNYTRKLLVEQLQIPENVVVLVTPFITDYLDDAWRYKHEARLRQRKLSPIEERARLAFFGLCSSRDLKRLWMNFEDQIAARLLQTERGNWSKTVTARHNEDLSRLFESIQGFSAKAKVQDQPKYSSLSMGSLYVHVSNPYRNLRDMLSGAALKKFDESFMHWLYWVYDPLSAITSYFCEHRSEGATRIRKGTASRADENEVIKSIETDWLNRNYGPEERPWLAWLLRFALPETTDALQKFREIPSALYLVNENDRWSHIAIDEAQDLSVAEASLLGSLVHPEGAVTISADFHQVVSPMHGMTDPSAFEIGNSMRGGAAQQQIYPFARNMRQSKQIGLFLQGFYKAVFGEIAPFDYNDSINDAKPRLTIAAALEFPRLIQQMYNVLKRSDTVNSIALLQINEDEETLIRIRSHLETLNVNLAPIWEATGEGLITTSVERIKGLEFDACLIIGLEDVDRSSLNFARNRAYVALSRPTRRLALLCEEFPNLLRKIDTEVFDVQRV